MTGEDNKAFNQSETRYHLDISEPEVSVEFNQFDALAPNEPKIPNSWVCFVSANTTNQLSLLKRLWGNDVATPMYKACKLLNMMKKDTKFGGEGKYVVINVSAIAGVSPNFQDALAAQNPSTSVRFFVPHQKQYAVWSLQNDVIARSLGDANAVLSVLKNELEKARRQWNRGMSRVTYGNQGGSAAQIATSTNLATATATIRAGADVAAFEKDLQVEFASDDGSASAPAGRRSSGGVPVRLQVLSVDRNNRTVTFNQLLNTVPSITTSDYMFWRGWYASTMTGVKGWNPPVAPSGGESFFGLDRTATDVQRLSGIRVVGSGTFIETLEDACAEARLAGVEEDGMVLCINPIDLKKLRKEIGACVEYDVQATVGFKAIKLATQIGELTLLSETDVPQGFGWILNPKEITLRTAGECPEDITDSKGGLLVDYSDDARQGRLGCYGNIFFDNPGVNVVIQWPS